MAIKDIYNSVKGNYSTIKKIACTGLAGIVGAAIITGCGCPRRYYLPDRSPGHGERNIEKYQLYHGNDNDGEGDDNGNNDGGNDNGGGVGGGSSDGVGGQ
ncbi:MAG: hypothetical protein PVJ67_00370 [Candidatus Pacearchaeota archaeon]|jgi:hypothetical protein